MIFAFFKSVIPYLELCIVTIVLISETPTTPTSADFQDPEFEFDEGGLDLESKEGRCRKSGYTLLLMLVEVQ